MSDETKRSDDRPVNGGSRPVPDPTVLTTEALTREVGALKELLTLQIRHEAEARESADTNTLDLMDREDQLIERQRAEQKVDTKQAVVDALSAAKEAVREQTLAGDKSIEKAERNTADQITQINVTFNTAVAGIERTMNDLKERVNKVESSLATHAAAQTGLGVGKEQNQGVVFNVIMGLVAIGSLITAFVAR